MNDTIENRNKGLIESYYLRNKRNSIYVALEEVEDTDFFWSRKELAKFDQLWNEDKPIKEIAKEMHRTELSLFLLAIDRIYNGRIAPREWKIF